MKDDTEIKRGRRGGLFTWYSVFLRETFGFGKAHVAVLNRCGECDERLGAAEVLQFIDEVIQLHGGLENNLDQHRIIAGYAAALNNIRD